MTEPGDLDRAISIIIRSALVRKRIDQRLLAARIGVTQDRLTRILTAQESMRITELYDICDVLHVNPADLVYAAEIATQQ